MLDALFVTFVVVQAAVLFGGHDHVLETEGLTYAEYARQGFWQLLRVLVGATCVTSVVVVISAIHRMWLYQQAYGFSVQRVMVVAIES